MTPPRITIRRAIPTDATLLARMDRQTISDHPVHKGRLAPRFRLGTAVSM
ncbi:MAG: hypothetical protein PHQ40_11545 [Anaerolineaceae bacterium]|nr:hypothetical protein [Anaerolineaceae bacterium]